MKDTILCDDRGRLFLPVKVREQYGQEFHVVMARDELILIPVSKSPLKELAVLGRKAGISKKPVRQLKKELQRQAEQEV